MGGCLGKEAKPVSDEESNKEEVALKTSNGASPAPQNNKRASARKSMTEPRAEVTHKSGSVESKFEVGKELGRGGFSIVKEGVDRATGEKVAIKFIEKKYVDQEELKLLGREIDIMKKVQHRNVLRLIEIYETDNLLSLVMELVNGGELFYKIVDKGSYSEREARDIIRQLVEGVDYLHSKGIAHRDLKKTCFAVRTRKVSSSKLLISVSPRPLQMEACWRLTVVLQIMPHRRFCGWKAHTTKVLICGLWG